MAAKANMNIVSVKRQDGWYWKNNQMKGYENEKHNNP